MIHLSPYQTIRWFYAYKSLDRKYRVFRSYRVTVVKAGIGSQKKSIGSTGIVDLPGLSQGRQYGEVRTELNQTFKELANSRCCRSNTD